MTVIVASPAQVSALLEAVDRIRPEMTAFFGCLQRFGFRDVELARVGPFLLLAGNTAAYRDRTATVQVASLVPVLAALRSAGGEIVEGPATAPNGARLIARHPDGAVFEYIETGEAG